MSAEFFDGPIDALAVYGLLLNEGPLQAESDKRISRIVRDELSRLIHALKGS